SQVLSVGIMQTAFESAMYLFIFLWGPVMEQVSQTHPFPYGIAFSIFMVCIMLGSIVFSALRQPSWAVSYPTILFAIFATCSASFCLPVPTLQHPALGENLVFLSFCLFELCCGIYYPTMGSLRAQVIPEATRSTVMNCFRIPLNLVVVGILLVVDRLSNTQRFLLCSFLMGLGSLAALVAMRGSSAGHSKKRETPSRQSPKKSQSAVEKHLDAAMGTTSSLSTPMLTRSRAKKDQTE
ncbi:Molybdate-anion transporter, partial [Kappamyces sp. JEL0680]